MNQYQAPIAIPPGETIKELMKESDMSVFDLARGSGYSVPYVKEVLSGKRMINDRFAGKLYKVFNVPAGYWISLESRYRQTLRRLRKEREDE